MKNRIRDIFIQNSKLISLVDKAVVYFREERYDKALGITAEVVEKLKVVTSEIFANREYFELVSEESVVEMLSGIVETKKNKDYVLLADLLTMQVSGFLCSVQTLIMGKEDFLAYEEERYLENIGKLKNKLEEGLLELRSSLPLDEDTCERLRVNQNALLDSELNPEDLLSKGYRVEFTSCGQMTVGVRTLDGRTIYLHSNNKVSEEAFFLAKRWTEKKYETYLVYGLGMGYHIKEMLYLAPHAKIEIYEQDMNILRLSCAFSELTELFSDDGVQMIYDPDFTFLRQKLKNVTSKERICIHYPSMCAIKDVEAKELLMDYIPWAKLVEEI